MAEIFNQQFLLQQKLGKLAMRFRGCPCDADQDEIARQYGEVVEELIRTGVWDEVPPPEDQLPDDQMPPSFKAYWSGRLMPSA